MTLKCKIFAISDLHLNFNGNKTMDKFGENWVNHHIKIRENWVSSVTHNDYVLICGDISWAMRLSGAVPDLEFISDLPGFKIFVKGNHDYWWDKTAKLNTLYDTMLFLRNDYFLAGDCAICGTRGWISPSSSVFKTDDKKVYVRELLRLETSLEKATRDGAEKIIVMIHFPVFTDKLEPTGFVDVIEKFPVFKVVYAHLHGEGIKTARNGSHNGTEYMLTSADFLEFKPRLVYEF